MKLNKLYVYPVKSCAGNASTSALVRRRGLATDRRWVIVDRNNKTLTGREHASIALMTVKVTDNGIQLGRHGVESLDIAIPVANAQRRNVTVWGDQVNAVDAGDTSADWLTRMVGEPARLCYMDSEADRPLDGNANSVSFADAYPLLLTNTASIVELGERAGEVLDMRRFRPNVVFESEKPFVEDTWRRIRIGQVEFDVSGPCERCAFTTIDPDNADSHPRQEPLRTLAQFRRNTNGEVCFGQNLTPLSHGAINLTDELEVLETGPARPELRQQS